MSVHGFMLEFVNNNEFYNALYPRMAAFLSTTMIDNRIELPGQAGSGSLQFLSLGPGIAASLTNIKLNEDVRFTNKKGTRLFYHLQFDETQVKKEFQVKIERDAVTFDEQFIASVLLTSSKSELSYVLPADTIKKTVGIMFTVDWLKDYLQTEKIETVIDSYLSLGLNHVNLEPFNYEYRRYFDEIFEVRQDDPLRELHQRNRVMILIELFFTHLFKRLKSGTLFFTNRMKREDLYKMMEVEALLVADLTKPPTISELSAITGISVSKLKSTFKTIYGMGLYEYFQKNRMQKARSLLLAENISVKEVGVKVGYTNLSNFSLAFKKEFGVLPSQI